MFATIKTLWERSGEDGFTLIELLVTMLLIGILATIAIPLFFNQTAKAKDAGAKTELRNLVELVEACRVDHASYSDCDEATELGSDAGGLVFGASPGNVGVIVSGSDYTAYAISKAQTNNSNHLFIWQHYQGDTYRYCLNMSLQPLNDGGCANSTW